MPKKPDKTVLNRVRRFLEEDEDEESVWPDDNGLQRELDLEEVARAYLAEHPKKPSKRAS